MKKAAHRRNIYKEGKKHLAATVIGRVVPEEEEKSFPTMVLDTRRKG